MHATLQLEFAEGCGTGSRVVVQDPLRNSRKTGSGSHPRKSPWIRKRLTLKTKFKIIFCYNFVQYLLQENFDLKIG